METYWPESIRARALHCAFIRRMVDAAGSITSKEQAMTLTLLALSEAYEKSQAARVDLLKRMPTERLKVRDDA